MTIQIVPPTAIVTDLTRQEKKAEDDAPNLKQTAGKYLPSLNIAFEQIEGQKFYLSNGKTATQIPYNINGQDIIFIPFPEESILWNPCTATPIKPVDARKLWSFVKGFIYKHLELPDDRLYDVLTAWVFGTWIPEAWEVVPYVFFFGVKNSGKTRGLEALQLICYRAKTSVASTAPALFRSIEKYGCLPFIDEAETLNQRDNTDIIACLNAGYRRRGARVERCQKSEDGNQDIATFDVFGFKAIAGTESLKSTLESRSVIINMAKNNRKVEPNINTKAAKSIRNGLLQWRFETLLKGNISTISEEELTLDDNYDSFDNFDDFDNKTRTSLNIPEELLNIPNGRIVELFTPLYKIAEAIGDESIKSVIVNYAKTVAGQQKTEENNSITADILLAILNCYETVENSFLSNDAIVTEFNKDRPLREQLTGEVLTNRIAAFGLQRYRGKKGKRGFEWDTKKLRALCPRYGFDADQYLKSPLLEASNSSKSSNSPPQTSTASTVIEETPSVTTAPNSEDKVGKTNWLSLDFNTIAYCKALEKEDSRLDQPCTVCQQNKPLAYTYRTYASKDGYACFECGDKIRQHIDNRED